MNVKTDLKKIFLCFFFQWKLRLSTFQIWHWGDRRGLGEALFYFETFDFLKIFTLISFTNTKIQLPQVPPRSPKCQIWKMLNLRFHWKKNHKKIFFRSVFAFTWTYVDLVWYSLWWDHWFWAWSTLSNTRPN